jgi:PEP-CTERM motif
MTGMKNSLLPCALALAATLAHAQPNADVDAGFTPWTDAGPVGSATYASPELHWLRESSGLWDDQLVQSWLLIWAPGGLARLTGQVDFGREIVGVLDTRGDLRGTAGLGRPDVVYDFSHAAVGLETTDRRRTSFADSVLSVSWTAGDPGDHVRVLTVVPEPATWLMLVAGLIGIGHLRSHRQD